jgi:predicted deacetylase
VSRRERPRRLAVALHDVEPATFERCALIRDWLSDHGVGRVTLLVIPARDLHPLGARSPEMTGWLLERQRAGDSIAQHGFQHDHLRRPVGVLGGIAGSLGGGSLGGGSAEFLGLDEGETRRAVDAGWRVLKLAGIEPDGFVAPAYAYTPALRRVLPRRFRWWASLMRLHQAGLAPGERAAGRLAPAWGSTGPGAVQRLIAPPLIRAGGVLGGTTLRLDLHPAALEHPRQMLALEWVLARSAQRRTAVTYEQLLSAETGAGARALAGPAPV